MKANISIGVRSSLAATHVSAETLVDNRMDLPIRQFSQTCILRMEQPASDDEEVGERRGDFEPMQILRDAAVTDFLEAKDPLDHPDGVLDLGANPRLVAVLRLLRLVDEAVASVAAVGEVPGTRRAVVDRGGSPLIALITPDARHATMQQVGQCIDVRDVGRRPRRDGDSLWRSAHIAGATGDRGWRTLQLKLAFSFCQRSIPMRNLLME